MALAPEEGCANRGRSNCGKHLMFVFTGDHPIAQFEQESEQEVHTSVGLVVARMPVQ